MMMISCCIQQLQWHMVLFYSFLTEVTSGSEFQATSTVDLSSSINKSGRQTICHDETVVYSCSTTLTGVLTWKIYPPDGQNITFTFIAGDTPKRFWNEKQYYALLQNNATINISSMLIIPYTPEWNGSCRIQCVNGNDEKKILLYSIAGSPTPPSSVGHAITECYVYLNWSTICDIDCGIIMIRVGNDNLLYTSYQAGQATLDISNYCTNSSITIKMYGINRCGMMSNHYEKVTVRIKQVVGDAVLIEIVRDSVITVVLLIVSLVIVSVCVGIIIKKKCKPVGHPQVVQCHTTQTDSDNTCSNNNDSVCK